MIQWGLGQQGGFQNALTMGMQMGQQARQQQDQREERNALAGYAANPTREGVAAVAKYNPQFAMGESRRYQAEDKQAQIAQVAQAAQKGDPTALGQLFTLAPDLWERFDDQQRDKVKASTSYMAQSAFQVGRLPEERRAAAWTAAVQQAEQSGMDIPAYLEGYSAQALNQALAVAEKTESYIKQFEPDWRAVPAGGYLENVNPLSNPQVGQGGAPAAAGGVQEGATATNPQTGAKIIYRGGQWAPVEGGGGGVVTSNFLDGF